MSKKPTCNCLQGAAESECKEVDLFHDKDGDVTIDCCFYNETSGVQEDIQLLWNFCPQCGEPNKDAQEERCDWCGDSAKELSHPHMFDMAIGKKMCRHCWDHDREVYKGSYGEDIGEFKSIKEATDEAL